MKRVIIPVALALASALGSSQTQPPDAITLEDKVKAELRILCYDECPLTMEDQLRRLGTSREISEVLLNIAQKYRAARTPGLNNQYLRSAVFELGKFPNSRAIPLLTGIVRSPNDTQDLKLFAVQSIGEIDPAGNRDLLRGLLRDNYVRYAAAEALAKTDDPSIIHDLEGMASREISPESRRRIQSLADTMRTRLIPR